MAEGEETASPPKLAGVPTQDVVLALLNAALAAGAAWSRPEPSWGFITYGAGATSKALLLAGKSLEEHEADIAAGRAHRSARERGMRDLELYRVGDGGALVRLRKEEHDAIERIGLAEVQNLLGTLFAPIAPPNPYSTEAVRTRKLTR